MKRILSLTLCILFALALIAGCAPKTPAPANDPGAATPAADQPAGQTGMFNPGQYTGVGNGRGGPIVVEGVFTADRIESMKVISQHETYLIGNIPAELYPQQVVDNQSVAVDLVSGATISSAGVITAIKDCITNAGGDPAALNAPIPKPEVAAGDTSADVVVVGSGAAGLTAASYAAAAGKKVILVEKLAILGGTSTYSIESFGASESKTAKALGVAATAQNNYDALVAGNPNGKPEAFDILAHNNGAAADWLRSIGALMPVAGSPTGVAPSREVGKMGVAICGALINEVKKAGVDTRTLTKATELIVTDGAVTGVKVEGPSGAYTIAAKSVILASGGYGANNDMVAQYKPIMKGYGYSCSPGATGDGQLMAQAVGAELQNMDYIRVNFTYHTKNGIVYYMGSLANTGGIFVTNEGVRMMNDQGGYGVGPSVVEKAGGTGWLIFDDSLIQSVQDVREYGELGLYQSANTIEELAGSIGVNSAALADTIKKYQGFVAAGKDEDFNRSLVTMAFDEPPYYACKFTCHVQGTFGGIATNLNTQVTKADGSVIPGLYAAGECAVVGTWGANPMAVNVVFGRIAGEKAAEYAK